MKLKKNFTADQTYRRQIADTFEFYGYQTYMFELARIFNQSPHTLSRRMESGWILDAALIAEASSGWNIHTQHLLADMPETKRVIKKTLTAFFKGKQNVRNVQKEGQKTS